MHKSVVILFSVAIILGIIILLVALTDEPTPPPEPVPTRVVGKATIYGTGVDRPTPPKPEPDDFTERMWRKAYGGLPSPSKLKWNLEGVC